MRIPPGSRQHSLRRNRDDGSRVFRRCGNIAALARVFIAGPSAATAGLDDARRRGMGTPERARRRRAGRQCAASTRRCDEPGRAPAGTPSPARVPARPDTSRCETPPCAARASPADSMPATATRTCRVHVARAGGMATLVELATPRQRFEPVRPARPPARPHDPSRSDRPGPGWPPIAAAAPAGEPAPRAGSPPGAGTPAPACRRVATTSGPRSP